MAISGTTLAAVAVGSPVLLVRAMAGVVYKRTLNMCATMLIACAGAVAIGDFWEAAAIVFFFALSEWLQEWCVHHTVAQTRSLGGLLPQTVELPGGGEKPLDDVAIGDVLVVKPGGRVPVDGVVVGDGAVVGARNEIREGARVWPQVAIPDLAIRYSSDA